MRAFNNPYREIPKDKQAWRDNLEPERRLIIEIGAGVGFHAIQYCLTHDDCQFIAVEKTSEKFQKFITRIANHKNIEHLIPVHANACQWIAENIQENEVDEYFILYPNPYPKEKQKNKRFMHMPFMQYLIQTMKLGARLTLATNIEAYHREAKDIYTKIWNLTLIHDALVDRGAAPRTHFEKKYFARGELCFELVLEKN